MPATLTLTDFLLARLAEDEAVARAASGTTWVVEHHAGGLGSAQSEAWAVDTNERRIHLDRDIGSIAAVEVAYDRDYDTPEGGCERVADADHIARHDPARVLSEVEAKRRIVDACAQRIREDGDGQHDMLGVAWTATFAAEEVLPLLAQPYADHPDFRDEWRA